MANIKSQIKRIKTNRSSELKNMGVKSAIKTYTAKLNKAIEAKDREAAEKLLKQTVITIDKAVSDGIVHRNNAANKKSRLMKKYNLLIGSKAEAASTAEEKPAAKSPVKKTPTKKAAAKTKTKKT